MAQITKDTIIADILEIAPDSAPLFFSIGMHCLGCAAAKGETLGEACEVHGVDFDEFYEQLKQYIKEE
jgi:hybrid cluster-associated redox disulfide protein